MNNELISLQEALGNLVVYYAKQERELEGVESPGFHERAIAKAMDTALSLVFRRLGLTNTQPATLCPSSASIQFDEVLRGLVGGTAQIAANLGAAFEQIRGTRLLIDSVGNVVVETSPERRGKGIYFTPVVLAEAIVKQALTKVLKDVGNIEDLSNIYIIDPAVGCGAFLLATVRIGSEILSGRKGFNTLSRAEIRAAIASHCIYGVDIDPIAIATTRALLQAEVGIPEWDGYKLDSHLRVADSISAHLSDFHSWFPQVFPAGFTAVITNPPWSKLRPLRHEFFEHLDERVRLYQGTELGRYLDAHLTELVSGAWSEHANRTLKLSRALRDSVEYALNREGAGDPDLYKYFTERSLALLSPKGVAALLLPSGVLRAQGSAGLRRLFRTGGTITQLIEYINRKKLFDIHSMYRFCTVLFEKGKTEGVKEAIFGRDVVNNDDTDKVEFSLDFLELVGGSDSLIPEVRSVRERDMIKRIYERYPIVANSASGWDFGFRREVDMTNDCDAFIPLAEARSSGYSLQDDGRWMSSQSDTVLVPVYEGRMVHQFDSVAKIHVSGQGRSATWTVPSISEREVRPHYLIAEDYLADRGWVPTARVGYCEISGHANERTLLAAMLPKYCVCGNKVPVLNLRSGGPDGELLWLALANSLVVDWVMRRFVSTTVNHFYWKNIPLPIRGAHPVEEALLIEAARMLSIQGEVAEDAGDWLGRRALIRATIDAIVMKLYGLNELDWQIILDDFKQLKLAHKRGGGVGVSLAELLSKASRALAEGKLELSNLETSFDLKARFAAAAYTPRDQARHL